MDLPQWAQDSVTVTRPARKASRGAAVDDWANATTHEIAGCSVQQTATTSDTADTAGAQTVDATLFAPPGADVAVGDRVTFQGHDYAIVGVPLSRTSPFGSFGHTKAYLRSWGSWRR